MHQQPSFDHTDHTHLAVQTLQRKGSKISLFIQFIDPHHDRRGVEVTCLYDAFTNTISHIVSNLGDMPQYQRKLLEQHLALEGVNAGVLQVIECDEASIEEVDPYFYGDDCGSGFNLERLPPRMNRERSRW